MIIPEKYSGLDLSNVKPVVNRNLIVANKYSYRIYSLPDLKYILDSIIFDKKIRAIYSQNEFVYVGCSNKLYTIKRNVLECQEYDDKIDKILVFHPIKIITTKHKLYINEKEMHFQGIRGILHIPTYLNKILLYTASYIKIINIISKQIITTIFSSQISDYQDSQIQLIKETQALDIVAIGTNNPSQVILFNILNNSIITKYELGQSSIKDIQFNKSGNIPYMGVVQDKSLILFNLNTQELVYTFNNSTTIDWALFYQDNTIYIGSQEQNSIQQFTLEENKIMSPVRQRNGVSQFINHCSFYGQQGEPQINYISTTNSEILYQSIVNQNLTAIKKGIINNFSFSTLRENDWANLLTTNRDNQLEFWNIYQKKLNVKLNGISVQGRILGSLVSKCGNYGFIATQNKIHKFTMQSGSYLMSYNLDAPYINMFLDLSNIYLIVALEGKLIQLDFVSGDCSGVLPLDSNVSKVVGSLTSQILAVSLDNNKILVIDYQTMKIIRSFEGHTQKILDMAMTIDNQHLISSSLDKKVKIWNLIYGNLIQEITLNKAIISLDISEGQLIGVFLNSRQVAVWTSHLNNPQQLAKAKRIVNMVYSSDLTIKSKDHRAALYGQVKSHKIEEETKITSLEIPQQPIDDEYIKFTLLEEGRWVPIQHIDQIRDRNRVKLADADVKMPFFMDFRNADIEKQNLLNEIKEQVKEKTKILKKKKDQFLAEIKSDFEKLVDQEDVKLIELIKTLSPTSYDYELRSILMGKPQNQLRILRIFQDSFKNFSDLDLKVTYLLRFLEIAREDMDLSMDEEIKPVMNAIVQLLESQWDRLDDQRSYIECVIEYSKTKI